MLNIRVNMTDQRDLYGIKDIKSRIYDKKY